MLLIKFFFYLTKSIQLIPRAKGKGEIHNYLASQKKTGSCLFCKDGM